MITVAQMSRSDLMELAVDMANTMGKAAFIVLKDDGVTTVSTRPLHKNPNHELLAMIYPNMAGVKE
jgi:hypothetical protein